MARNSLSEQKLDQLLRRTSHTLPVDRSALDDPHVQAALAKLQRNFVPSEPREALSTEVKRPIYRRHRVTLGAAAIVVALAAVLGVGTLTSGSLPLAVQPAAAAELNELARAAAAQPTPAAGQWEYLEVRLEVTGTMQAGNPTDQGTNPAGYPTVAFTNTQTLENWTAPDGEVRQRTTGNSFSFLTPQDEATYVAHKAAFDAPPDQLGRYMVIGVTEDKMFPGGHSPQPVWETSPPSDPQTLIKELWSEYLSNVDAQGIVSPASLVAQRPGVLWTDLSDLLLNSTSTRLRATAFAALAYVPDTTVMGNETDQLGRSGIAISWTGHGPGYGETLIVSASTSDLLEEDDTYLQSADGLPAGTVAHREIFLKRAIVDSDTALPGGGSQPIAPPTDNRPTSAARSTTRASQG